LRALSRTVATTTAKEDSMRSIATLMVVVGLAATALAAAGCGGSDDDPLVGQWEQSPGDILVRFDRDGGWVVDTDGSLEDDVFTGGQYEQNGQRVTFTPSEGGLCRGQAFAWEVDFVEDDVMEVDVVDGGCGAEEGEHWRFAKTGES
jgi:hypothetical protein